MSVRPSISPSVVPHGTLRLAMDGFSLYFAFEVFLIICREIKVSLKSDKH